MKAESTIRKQIRQLRRLADDERQWDSFRARCYDAYRALRWVIEDVAWTPAGEAKKEAAKAGGKDV